MINDVLKVLHLGLIHQNLFKELQQQKPNPNPPHS